MDRQLSDQEARRHFLRTLKNLEPISKEEADAMMPLAGAVCKMDDKYMVFTGKGWIEIEGSQNIAWNIEKEIR